MIYIRRMNVYVCTQILLPLTLKSIINVKHQGLFP